MVADFIPASAFKGHIPYEAGILAFSGGQLLLSRHDYDWPTYVDVLS
jgi:hypothetical protein